MDYYNDLFVESKLPQPFSQKELYSYFEKMKAGDPTAREEIITHNIRLVINEVVKKFSETHYEEKELVSIGLIGLIKSVDTFDISKEVQFSPYSKKCIDNEILMFIRKGKKNINDYSLDTPLGNDNKGHELKIEDTLYDENSNFVANYETQEQYRAIRQIVSELKEPDREIIKKYFGFLNDKPMTQQEIADSLEISRSYVCKIIKRNLTKISLQLQKQGLIEIHDKNKKSYTKNSPKRKENISKKLRTIYEYFKDYKKEEVNLMLSKLTEEERKLVELRYGADLENPVTDENWTIEYGKQFYGNLIPKMRRLLSNPNRIRKVRGEENLQKSPKKQVTEPANSISKVPTTSIEESSSTQSSENMTKEDYIKILEKLKTPTFGELLKILSLKEAVIICLKLGYIDGKYFSTDSVASFLGIEEDEVRETTKKVLLIYKEKQNNFIDQAISFATEQPLELKKQK